MSNAKGERGKPDVREVLEVQRGLPLEGQAQAEELPVPEVPQPAAPDGALPEVGAMAGREARHSAPFNLDQAIDDLVGALTDPIIVHDPGWPIPDQLKKEIPLARMAQLMKMERGVATDLEALTYLNNASMIAPMRSEWVNIYMYLFTKWMGADKVPEDLRHESITQYEEGLLLDMKTWLWRHRVKARGERRRQDSHTQKAEIAAQAPEQMELPLW
jgi:hypothetical protein